MLVGCGLGGGSLINAGVALRPDPRVFRDAVWPDEIAEDGLIEEGYARAARWVRPARDAGAAERTKYKALQTRQRGPRQGAGRGAGGGELCRRRSIRPAWRSRPARAAATAAAAATSAPRTRWRSPICPMPSGTAPRSSPTPGCATSPRRREGGWHVHFERQDGGGAPRRRHRDGRHGRAGGRHAGLDRDPAALARARARPVRPAGHALLGQRRHHRLRLRRQAARQRHRRRPSRQGRRASTSAPASPARSRSSTQTDLANSLTIQEGVLPSALAPLLPALFIPNGRLLGALQSLIAGVYKGPFASLQTFFAVSHDTRRGAPRPGGRPDRAALARRQGRAGLPPPRRGAGGAGAPGAAAATSRTRSPAP